MDDDHVTVNGDYGHRESGHVNEDGLRQVDQTTHELTEGPVLGQVTHHVQRKVQEGDEEVAECKVCYEGVRHGVQSLVTIDHLADDRIADEGQHEDDQVGDADGQDTAEGRCRGAVGVAGVVTRRRWVEQVIEVDAGFGVGDVRIPLDHVIQSLHQPQETGSWISTFAHPLLITYNAGIWSSSAVATQSVHHSYN